MFEGVLKLQLAIVSAMDGVGCGGDDLIFAADLLPQLTVVKLATEGLAGGVVDVLYIGKYGDLGYCHSFWFVAV